MKDIVALFTTALRHLIASPLAFFLVSLPTALCEIIFEYQTPADNTQPNYAALIFAFLGIWVLNNVICSASFTLVQGSAQSSARRAFRQAFHVFPTLAPLALITGVAVILGCLLVLPGLYFLTIFAFVPCVVADLPPQRSIFDYLALSQGWANRVFVRLFVLTTLFFLLNILVSVSNGPVEHLLVPLISSPWQEGVIFLSKLLPYTFLTALTNAVTATYYLRLRGEHPAH
ncbi:hypothetical protein K2X33_08850 [bacterium]|nr:hypothetical protein [bacterium]